MDGRIGESKSFVYTVRLRREKIGVDLLYIHQKILRGAGMYIGVTIYITQRSEYI